MRGCLVSGRSVGEIDGEFVAALLGLLDSGTHQLLLTELGVRIASDILVAAADVGKALVPIPVEDNGTVDSNALVDSFLQHVRPSHDAHDYLDDYWNFIWEAAWPEGIWYAVLGSAANDGFMAVELMNEIERKADEIGLTEPPPFEAEDLEIFIAEWRKAFLIGLAEVAANT